MTERARPRVIIRLYEDPSQEGFSDSINYLEERDPTALRRIRAAIGEFRLLPVFSDEVRERLPELQKRASELDPTYETEPLSTFFYVEAEQANDLEIVRKVFNTSSVVRSADIEIPGPDPVVNAADDPRSPQQTYLDLAPGGIDARYAWTFTGGDGAGQTVVDIEQGWTLDHEDLVAHGATQLNGTIVNSSRRHGTSVLGELCAVDNTLGCVGIAPNVAKVFVASRNPSLANSIVDVLSSVDFGDVILLETQDGVAGSDPIMYGPSEIIDAVWESVRLATALGVIVVAAGGNGTNNGSTPAVNLDTLTDSMGQLKHFRDPGNPEFRDSGAIIVAAATSAAPHTRLDYSTFGQRIDCYGWGQNIETCSSDPLGATDLYRSNFAGTSGASPMVAGAALCVQGIYEAATGGRLSPRQMREILSNPANNTSPAASEATAMGVMPDLRGIIDSMLAVVPDIYIRDNVGDIGDPHTGAISSSPDIILLPTTVANPQAAFGEGSGTENDASLGFEATAGQDNFLYARVRNRGGTPAINVSAEIFWSPPSTLVTPDLWTSVGTVTIPSVPIGDMLTCSDALTWPETEIPAPGHYCFVGLIGTDGDPAPAPADFLDFNNFRNFIRNNNNVTWHNFNVVPRDPGDPEAEFALPWLMPGAPEERIQFALEITLRLPKRAEVLLEMPFGFLRDFDAQVKLVDIDKENDRGTAQLPPMGRLLFGPALMPARARYQMSFRVRLNSKDEDTVYPIDVRQLFEGKEEVGRLSWRFDPRAKQRRKEILALD
ncbi:MAG: S8 family peptidase [Kiloniellales bacterium]|nr:S8 family peptidase [Kiloniellales bacterium]